MTNKFQFFKIENFILKIQTKIYLRFIRVWILKFQY